MSRSHQSETQQAVRDSSAANVSMPERIQRRAAPDGAAPGAAMLALPSSAFAVQLFADAVSAGVHPTERVQRAAAHGLSGTSSALPHLGAIQQSFGRHDVSGVQAHVGGRAAEGAAAMGAHGYAAGNSVAFASSPDLHLAAHEAAHVVQQRAGVHLKGGVGEVGDVYERHADAVADMVVQGKSAESLLDTMAGGSSSGSSIQRVAIQMDGDDDLHGAVHRPTRTRARPEASAPAVEGEFEGVINTPAIHIASSFPFTPYARVTGTDLVGSIHYRFTRPEHGEGEGHGGGGGEHAEPSTVIHAGPTQAVGAHGHSHGELEAGITQHVMSLGGMGNFDVGSAVSIGHEGAAVGVSAGGGLLRIGAHPTLAIPIPSFNVHLVDWERGREPEFCTATVEGGLPTIPIQFTILGEEIEIVFEARMIVHLAPNWERILGQLTSAATAEVETGTALSAAADAGASEGTLAAITADGAAMGEVAAAGTMATTAVALAACVGVAAVTLALGYEAFHDEIEAPHELGMRARGVGHSLYNYCMSYAQVWLGSPTMPGAGGTEGAADARRDMAGFRSRHPGADPTASARRWGQPAIYREMYAKAEPLARSFLNNMAAREGVDEGLAGGIITDAMHSVSYGEPSFRHWLNEH